MQFLEEAARKYGANDIVINARKECETKRQVKADELLIEAMQTARQSMQKASGKEALVKLRRAEPALPFSTVSLRQEYEHLKTECAATSRSSQSPTPTSAAERRGRPAWHFVFLVIILIGLTTAALFRMHRHKYPMQVTAPPSHAPAITVTDMEINASPWAKIAKIQDEEGKYIPLPDGEPTTPLRLDNVKVGKYKVMLVGPKDQQQVVDCNVSRSNHLCVAQIEQLDIHQVLAGDQR